MIDPSHPCKVSPKDALPSPAQPVSDTALWVRLREAFPDADINIEPGRTSRRQEPGLLSYSKAGR